MSKSSKLKLMLLVVLSASVGMGVTSRVESTIEESGEVIGEGLSDSEKWVLEGFAARLESYREQLNIPGRSFRSLVVSQILEPAQMMSTAPALSRSRLRNIREDRIDEDAEERFNLVNRELAFTAALSNKRERLP